MRATQCRDCERNVGLQLMEALRERSLRETRVATSQCGSRETHRGRNLEAATTKKDAMLTHSSRYAHQRLSQCFHLPLSPVRNFSALSLSALSDTIRLIAPPRLEQKSCGTKVCLRDLEAKASRHQTVALCLAPTGSGRQHTRRRRSSPPARAHSAHAFWGRAKFLFHCSTLPGELSGKRPGDPGSNSMRI